MRRIPGRPDQFFLSHTLTPPVPALEQALAIPPGSKATLRQVVCPFCSLLCDDLVVERSGSKLNVTKNTCPRAVRGFEAAGRPVSPPHVHGRPVSMERAVTHAAAILRDSRQPLVAGLGTDVRGSRAALALAERCGAAVDHMHGAAMQNNLSVVQGNGWMMTTLAEVKNRADVVVMVGTDAVDDFPRFYERFLLGQRTLTNTTNKDRQIIYIGDKLDSASGRIPGAPRPQNVNCSVRELTDVLGALRVVLEGGSPEHSPHMSRRRLTDLERVANTLRKAHYGVFVWAPGQLPPAYGELIVRDIVDIIFHLNETTRFSGLSLGGNDGGVSFQNVCVWQTGFPPPVCFPNDTVIYDPGLYRSSIMVETGTVDALLWLSCFGPSRSPNARAIPTILVGRAARRHVADVEVYLPAGVPGVDHDGNLFRTDSVVSLPLRTLRPGDTLPAADLLDRIRERI